MEQRTRRRSYRDHASRDVRNATFSLPVDLLSEVDAAVASGAAANKTAFVEQALRHELTQMRRLARLARLEEARHDPLFVRDLTAVEEDFAFADAESAGEIV